MATDIVKKIDFKKITNGLIIFIGIGILCHLAFLYFTVEGDITESLKKLKWYYLIPLGILAVLPTVFHALRLFVWSKFVDHPLTFKDAMTIIISNDLGSALTPTIIGGGPVKLAMLISKGMSTSKATFLVLLSATEDIVFYAIGIALSMYYMHDTLATLLTSLAEKKLLLYTILVVIIALMLLPRIGIRIPSLINKMLPERISSKLSSVGQSAKSSLYKIWNAYKDIYKRGKLLFLFSLTFLFLQWMAKFTILAILLHALGIDFTLFEVYIKQWILTMGLLFVPTPGASGGAEAAFVLMFGDLLTGDIMKIIMSVWRFFTYFFMMFTSVIIFQFIGRVK